MRGSFITLTAALALGSVVQAADARMPVYQPTTITVPGAYYLTRDISGSGPVITIAADGVDLDLNGFAVSGDGTADGISVSGRTNVRVRNGLVWNARVWVSSSKAVWLESIEVAMPPNEGVSVSYSEAVTLRDCSVSDPGDDGIRLTGAGPYLLVGNRVRLAGDDGLSLFNIAGSIIEGTTITGVAGSRGAGITDFSSNGVRYANSRIVEGFTDGMLFFGSSGNRITGNSVYNAAADGFNIYDPGNDNLVTGNTIHAGQSGLVLYGDRSVLVGNVTNDSLDGLLIFGDDNVLRRNVSRGNTDDYSNYGAGTSSGGDNFIPTRQ